MGRPLHEIWADQSRCAGWVLGALGSLLVAGMCALVAMVHHHWDLDPLRFSTQYSTGEEVLLVFARVFLVVCGVCFLGTLLIHFHLEAEKRAEDRELDALFEVSRKRREQSWVEVEVS